MISQAIGAAAPISPVTRADGAQVSLEAMRTGAPDHVRNGLMPALPAPERHTVTGAACPDRPSHERSMDQGALVSLPPEMRQQVLGAARFTAGELAAIAATCSVLSCDVASAFAGIPAEERLSMWFQACSDPEPTGVQFLLDHGFDPSARDSDGRSSLQISLQHNAEETAALLLKADADGFGATTSDGGQGASRELLFQIARGNVDAVSKLLQLGASANTVGKHNQSALWTAVKEQDVEIVREMLAAGADPNVSSSWDHSTPLWNAVQLMDAPIIELLLRHPGIHISTPARDGSTPFGRAQTERYRDKTARILNLFERHVLERSHPASRKWTRASIAGDVVMLRQMFETHGRSYLDCISPNGGTALHLAAWHGREEAVRQLLTWGAKVNVHDGNGITPLSEAVMGGHLGTVNVLIDHGADPNILKCDGDTPLYEAAYQGREDIVKALLDGGAETNLIVGKGRPAPTALQMAVLHERDKVAALLLRRGANPHLAGSGDLTTAMWASRFGTPEIKAVFAAHLAAA